MKRKIKDDIRLNLIDTTRAATFYAARRYIDCVAGDSTHQATYRVISVTTLNATYWTTRHATKLLTEEIR